MPLKIKNSLLGIQITVGDEDQLGPPVRSSDADQEHPRRNYVYAHVDPAGNVFYIGKGKRRRAWSSEDRTPPWTRHVGRHLQRQYTVVILSDNLDTEEAKVLEDESMSCYGANLVNVINPYRETDFAALELFHKRRDANRELLQKAREAEKKSLEGAADMYIEVIAAIQSYQPLKYEPGLYGELIKEEAEENGRGEIDALDRLTICLTKLGRAPEAASRTEQYFSLYKGDLQRAATKRIRNRIAKALAEAGNA